MSDLEAEDSRRPLGGQWLTKDRPLSEGCPLADAGPDRRPAAVCVRRAPGRYAGAVRRVQPHTAVHRMRTRCSTRGGCVQQAWRYGR